MRMTIEQTSWCLFIKCQFNINTNKHRGVCLSSDSLAGSNKHCGVCSLGDSHYVETNIVVFVEQVIHNTFEKTS